MCMSLVHCFNNQKIQTHQTHATVSRNRQAIVIAEARNLDAGRLARTQHGAALGHLHRLVVDKHLDHLGRGRERSQATWSVQCERDFRVRKKERKIQFKNAFQKQNLWIMPLSDTKSPGFLPQARATERASMASWSQGMGSPRDSYHVKCGVSSFWLQRWSSAKSVAMRPISFALSIKRPRVFVVPLSSTRL